MKLLFLVFFPFMVFGADKKISELPLGVGSTVGVADSFPYVDATSNSTKRLTIYDLINVPAFTGAYVSTSLDSAQIYVGNSLDVATARTMSGDATLSNTGVLTVATVGGSSASAINTAAISVAAATPSPTASTLVLRDINGNFSANIITAALTGNASTATALAANPADCSAGNAATSIAANGDLTCSPFMANPMTTAGDMVYGGTSGSPSRLIGAAGVLVNSGSLPSWAQHNPTVQRLTSGTNATYTTPAGVKWIRIRMVGGGGGGQGGSSAGSPAAAGNGGNTCFGTNATACTSPVLQANGGVGGVYAGGSTGGSVTVNAPAITVHAVVGGQGLGGLNIAGAHGSVGGSGAPSPFGGAGAGTLATAGGAAQANTGSGGGGGAGSNSVTTSLIAGSGGGAGGYIDAIIASPASTYYYTIGTSGTGGTPTGSGQSGGDGGTGVIIVEEYYH